MRIDQFIMSQEVIDRLRDVLLLVGVDGCILDANAAALDCYGHSHTEMLALNLRDIRSLRVEDDIDTQLREAAKSGLLFETEHRRRDGTQFPVEVWMAPVHVDGEAALLSVVRDISERLFAQERMDRLNRIYAILSGINQAIVHVREPMALFDEACRVIVEDGGLRAAWVGLVDPDGKRVRVVAQAGVTGDYLETVNVILGDEQRGGGPTGVAISERRHVTSQDIEHDPMMAPWRESALRSGYRSSASFPLVVGDAVVGAFTIYADEPEFFDDRQVELLDELAADVSFAMEFARGEEGRKQTEQALEKSERDLKEAQRLSGIGSWDWDLTTDTISWSDEYYLIFGFDPAQSPPGYENHLRAYTRESAARLDAAVKRNLQTGEPYEVELELARPGGARRWIVARSETKYDAQDRIIGLRGTAQDITERKTAEAEIERRGSRLEELLDERDRNVELLARSLSSVIAVVGRVVETRDPYTAGHERRVAELAVRIAEELHMPAVQIEQINIAALVHDVGKISVPSEILSKPGHLSPIEFELVKGHSESGYEILTSANVDDGITEMVHQHHERCDGSGYPRGLGEDEIAEGAKVLMVADVVEAMTSHRPYRPGLGVDAALAEIERGAGLQYDHDVVAACRRVFREGGFAFSAV